MLGCRVITTVGWGGGVYLIKGLREISIRMLALADCDAVTASGWESPILQILITINVASCTYIRQPSHLVLICGQG